jgi:hypothetical protein
MKCKGQITPSYEEIAMNTIKNSLKTLACGMGALAITAVLSWTFVQSTSAVPGATASAQMAKLTIQQRHVWFGQSQPAVLVD